MKCKYICEIKNEQTIPRNIEINDKNSTSFVDYIQKSKCFWNLFVYKMKHYSDIQLFILNYQILLLYVESNLLLIYLLTLEALKFTTKYGTICNPIPLISKPAYKTIIVILLFTYYI